MLLSGFSLQFSGSVWLALILAAVAAILAFFSYRRTNPPVRNGLRYTLMVLRTLSLVVIVFLITEPLLIIRETSEEHPVAGVFIDNSLSMKYDDGTDRTGTVREFISQMKGSGIPNVAWYSFGSETHHYPAHDSLNKALSFSERSTDFSSIFSKMQLEKKLFSSITIISDGSITSGSTPVFEAERMGIPVYTVAVGDSARVKDIAVNKILHNDIVFQNVETTILATVTALGTDAEGISVSLSADNREVTRVVINLQQNESMQIPFQFRPSGTGEQKLTITASSVGDEKNLANNSRTVFVKVENNKRKVFLISGSLSSDFTFVRNALTADTNLTITTLTETGPGRFLEKNAQPGRVREADILVLVNYPSVNSNREVSDLILETLRRGNTSLLHVLSNNSDPQKLKWLESELPFTFSPGSQQYREVRPLALPEKSENALLRYSRNAANDTWNTLPPVMVPDWNFKARPESEVLLSGTINSIPTGIPLMVVKRIGNKRALSILAGDIWRWKLQSASIQSTIFDEFFGNTTRWLSAITDKKQVQVRPLQQLYASGERVEFSGEVFDESFNPLPNAEVKLSIRTPAGNSEEIYLNPAGNGLYEGFFDETGKGDYFYQAVASLSGKRVGTDQGRFTIGDVERELISPELQYDFLANLSNATAAKTYYNKEYSDLFETLRQVQSLSVREKSTVFEYDLRTSVWLLSMTVLLLAIEWFLRKRAGML